MDALWVWPVLFATGLGAGFVDSIAGGGGLLTLPVLLNLGLAPQQALATNKLQALFGSGSATWHYANAGLIEIRNAWLGIFCTIAGAVGGTVAVIYTRPELLKQLMPWLLLGVAAYLLARPRFGEGESRPAMPFGMFYVMAGFALGFYDGFFGPGTGSLWTMALVAGLGYNLTRATAHTKLMNFASNIASVAMFVPSGHIWYAAGLTMGVGQLIGARLGSRAVVKRGARFIRPVFIAVVIAITIRLVYDNLSHRR